MIYSQDSFDLTAAKIKIKAQFLSRCQGGAVFDFDAKETTWEELSEALLRSSLFGEKRLVIIKNLFSSQNKKKILALLPSLTSSVSVLLIEENEIKEFKASGLDLMVRDVKSAALNSTTLVRKLTRAGLSQVEIREFQKKANLDKWWRRAELTKIELAERAGLANQTRELIYIPSLPTVFKLADIWLSGNRAALVSEYIKLSEKRPEEIVGWLGRVLAQLALILTGKTPKEAGVQSFAANLRVKQAKKVGFPWIKKSYHLLSKLDWELKTGQTDSESLLFFLLKTAPVP